MRVTIEQHGTQISVRIGDEVPAVCLDVEDAVDKFPPDLFRVFSDWAQSYTDLGKEET